MAVLRGASHPGCKRCFQAGWSWRAAVSGRPPKAMNVSPIWTVHPAAGAHGFPSSSFRRPTEGESKARILRF